MGQKRSFQIVNHRHLWKINVNESLFFGPKWVKPNTNHKIEIFLDSVEKILIYI